MQPSATTGASIFDQIEAGFFRLLRKKPPVGTLGSSVFWLSVITVLTFLLAWLPGAIGDIFASLASLTFLAVVCALIPLAIRWVRWHMLWELRNRLRVTYLLIGLAPVVLFAMMTALAGYVFSGQFANFAATEEIKTLSEKLGAGNQALATQVAHLVAEHGGSLSELPLSDIPFSTEEFASTVPSLQLGAFVDGRRVLLSSLPDSMQMRTIQPPAWANDQFRGLVIDHDHVYFRAISFKQTGSHTVVVLTSLPVNKEFLERLASGLGKITVMPDSRLRGTQATAPTVSDAHVLDESGKEMDSVLWKQPKSRLEKNSRSVATVSGGTLAKPVNIFDIPIDIPTYLETRGWHTGNRLAVMAVVTSRPSLLYQRLFRQSVSMGSAWRVALFVAALIFGVLQMLALWMASRLSSTITQSVADLYQATRAVDEGKFDHRIVITRNDQLAELSRSFNRMASSLERSLIEQHEKERMQSELAIAQEVQANLFPNINISLPTLELYGICRPARAVSGDYYDFLLFGESSVGLAIGDISGKGISAALLMATLHSAMRAYRFSSEEIIERQRLRNHSRLPGSPEQDQENLSDLFQSPGKILSLLNRHLYLSTQPEKYATLFLAHYDADTSGLRYCNGGHLPPVILRANGRQERLDRGGTVVGLIEGVTYEEGRVTLSPGDLFVGYTDGVTEPENEFGDFGEARMLDVIQQNRHLPLAEISTRLMQALDDWIGASEQPDDITLVLARQR